MVICGWWTGKGELFTIEKAPNPKNEASVNKFRVCDVTVGSGMTDFPFQCSRKFFHIFRSSLMQLETSMLWFRDVGDVESLKDRSNGEGRYVLA